jgi:LysR family transcriptional activator of nhaA
VLNFNHLYYFHVTAAEGGVKPAAERLGVTQPTVSEQIRLLERALGVQLFERTSTGLRLTQAGRDAYAHTTTMFLAGERLVEGLGKTIDPVGVTLRVAMSAAMARTVAADFLMPVLTVEQCRPVIRTGEFNELLRELRAHEVDLVVGESEPLDVARAGLEVALVDRPTLVAIVGPTIEPREDWNNLSLLEFRAASAYHWEVERYLQDNGLHPKLMGELDDAFLMLEAVIRGGFVAFVPRSVAREAIRQKRVKVLATIGLSNAGVYAVYLAEGESQLVRAAVAQLIENVRLDLAET